MVPYISEIGIGSILLMNVVCSQFTAFPNCHIFPATQCFFSLLMTHGKLGGGATLLK